MLFEVTRTSIYTDNKPFENCKEIQLTHLEIRTLKTPNEFDDKFGYREGKWLEKGTNHRIINGRIARDLDKENTWGIEIGSLEELMQFVESVKNDVIITTSTIDKKTPSLEIYDDYRE